MNRWVGYTICYCINRLPLFNWIFSVLLERLKVSLIFFKILAYQKAISLFRIHCNFSFFNAYRFKQYTFELWLVVMYIWLYKRRKQNNGSLINQICFGGILNACTVILENITFYSPKKFKFSYTKSNEEHLKIFTRRKLNLSL